ncbi:MAG TPA: hypothetical protein VLE23_14675 [Geminicoccaceae bacterium]|nr:hypothetical protein [Geminicoccaceae bacterium]
MAQAYERARPAAKPWPWRLPLVALVTAALVSLLLFVRVPCTEVTLDLGLSSLGFQVGGPGRAASIALTGAEIAATRVTVRGIDTIAAPPLLAATTPGRDWLSFHSNAGLLVNPIDLASGTWVRLSPPRSASALTLRFRHDSESASITLHLPADVASVPPGVLPDGLGERGESYTVTLSSAPNQPLDMELTPQPRAGATLSETLARVSETFDSELPITGLILEQGDPSARRRGTFSSVLDGSVYREALAGNAHDLRRGEYLRIGDDGRSYAGWRAWTRPIEGWLFPRFASCRVLGSRENGLSLSGVMTTISIAPERLALQAQLDTRSLAVGSRGETRDLMPRLLEWLQANAEAGLFWSVFLYLFLVVLLPLLRFWGIQR